ncbi:hypothetical protein [Sphaerospermopsis torques-reginae]|uniref:Uncharacterized protein n=1 Tax=Sphaerospermopsis torques-reginae ITEP-024 TaxID=984208 RepID=A0ABX8WUI8_9CYAN|nr:hypothetical protein [Sphaerospermopsis torques-reginae]QYX30065.1 hypothetical protein K2F26_13945 [Sphaerospermopsis torques-reginae ITEP-024]
MELFLIEIHPTGACEDEIKNLIEREEIAMLAREKFMTGEISFSDFLDCLEIAQVDVNDFLNINDENARLIGF